MNKPIERYSDIKTNLSDEQHKTFGESLRPNESGYVVPSLKNLKASDIDPNHILTGDDQNLVLFHAGVLGHDEIGKHLFGDGYDALNYDHAQPDIKAGDFYFRLAGALNKHGSAIKRAQGEQRASNAKVVSFKNASGQRLVLHPAVRSDRTSDWQLSHIGSDGRPTGHSNPESFHAGLHQALGVFHHPYYNHSGFNIEWTDQDGTKAPYQTKAKIDRYSQDGDYRGVHKAPTGEFGEGSLDAMHRTYPDDIYSKHGPVFYGDRTNNKWDREMHSIITSMRGKPDAIVKVYRAVPKGSASKVNPGDWVTPHKGYAEMHGDRFDNGADILEHHARASDLFTEGNSIYEFGWSPKMNQSTSLTDRFAASFAFHIDRYAGKNQPGLFDHLTGDVAFNSSRPSPSSTAPVQKAIKPSKMVTGSLFDQPPPTSVPNDQAKPGQQLGLFGDAPLPKPSAPKLDVGVESKGKQKNLFDTHGNADQMMLFGDKATPDTFEDRVSSSVSAPAEKPKRAGLGKFMKGEKEVPPKSWSSKPQFFSSEEVDAGGEKGVPTLDEEYAIVQTLKEKNPISLEEFRKRHFKAILASMMHQHDPGHPLRLRLEDLERKYPEHFQQVSKQAEIGLREQLDRVKDKDPVDAKPVNPLARPEDPDHKDHNLSLVDDDRKSELDRNFDKELSHPGLRPFLLDVAKKTAGGDHQAAEDIVQDAMTRAYRSRHSYDPSKPFQTWMANIVRRLGINAFRDRNRKKRGGGVEVGSLDIDAAGEDAAGLHDIIGSDKRRMGPGFMVEPDAEDALRKHVSFLPDDQRQAMDLHMQGLSKADIAKRLKESQAIVGRRINTALETLRAKLGDKNYSLNALIERYCEERDRDYYAMCRRVYRYTVFGDVDQYAEPKMSGRELNQFGPYSSNPPSRPLLPKPPGPLESLANPPHRQKSFDSLDDMVGTAKARQGRSGLFVNKPSETDQSFRTSEPKFSDLNSLVRKADFSPTKQSTDASKFEPESQMMTGQGISDRPDSISPRHELHLQQVARNPNAGNLAHHLHNIGQSLQSEWESANKSWQQTNTNNGGMVTTSPHDHVNWGNVRKHLNDLNSLHRDGMSRGINVANIANYNGTIPKWLIPKLAGGQKFFNPELLAGQWKEKPAWNEKHDRALASAQMLGDRYDPHDTPDQARATMDLHRKANPQMSYDIIQHPRTGKWYVGQWDTPQARQDRARSENERFMDQARKSSPDVIPWQPHLGSQLTQNHQAHDNMASAQVSARDMASAQPNSRFGVTQHPQTGKWYVGKFPPTPGSVPPIQGQQGQSSQPQTSQRSPQLPTPGQQQGRERPDIAEFRQAFQKQFGGPTQPDSKSLGIKNAFADMGAAIGDNLKRQLWESHRNGLTTMAGVKDPILSAAAQHGISRTDKQAFMNFINAYGQNPSAFASPPTQFQTSQPAAQPRSSFADLDAEFTSGLNREDWNKFLAAASERNLSEAHTPEQFHAFLDNYLKTRQSQPSNSQLFLQQPVAETADKKPASDLDRFNYKPTRPFDPNASQHHLQMLFPNHPAVTPEVMQEWDKIAANYDNNNPSQSIRAFEEIKNKIANTDPASIRPSDSQQFISPTSFQSPASDPFGNLNQELLGSPFRQFGAVPNAGDQLFKKGQRPVEQWWIDRQKELARQKEAQSEPSSPRTAEPLPVQASDSQVTQPQQPEAPSSPQQQNPAITALREQESQLQQLIQRTVQQEKQFAQTHPEMVAHAQQSRKAAIKQLDEVHRQMGRMMAQEQVPAILPQDISPQDASQPAAQSSSASSPSLFDQPRQPPSVKPKNPLLKTPYTPRAIADFKKALENMRIGRQGANAPRQDPPVNPVDAGYDAFEAARARGDLGDSDAQFDTSFDTDAFDMADEKKKIDEPAIEMSRTKQRTVQVGRNAFATAHFRDEDQSDLYRLGMLQRRKGTSGKTEESQLLQRLKESTRESESSLRNRAQFIATHVSEAFRNAKHGDSMHIDEPVFSSESVMTPGKMQHATRQLKDFILREQPNLFANKELDHNDLLVVVDYASMEREMLKKQIDAAHAAKNDVFPDNWRNQYEKEKREKELEFRKQKEAKANELSQDQSLSESQRNQLLAAYTDQKDKELKEALKRTMRHLLASMRGKRGYATKVFRGSDQDIDSLANPKSTNALESVKRNAAFVGMDEIAERLNPEVIDFLAGPTGESDVGDEMGRRYRALNRILNNDIPKLPPLDEFFGSAISRLLNAKESSNAPAPVYTEPFSMVRSSSVQRYSLMSKECMRTEFAVAINKFLQKSA